MNENFRRQMFFEPQRHRGAGTSRTFVVLELSRIYAVKIIYAGHPERSVTQSKELVCRRPRPRILCGLLRLHSGRDATGIPLRMTTVIKFFFGCHWQRSVTEPKDLIIDTAKNRARRCVSHDMKRIVLACCLVSLLSAPSLLALSESLPAPSIRFPRNFDTARAEKILEVLRRPEFHYVDGLTSLWPPKWGTTLVYDGDARTFEKFLIALRKLDGIAVNVTLSRDLAKESGTGHSAGAWWVMYHHTTPDLLIVRVNLAAEHLKLEELKIPISETAIQTPLTPEATGPGG
jgi:hypothetical protein